MGGGASKQPKHTTSAKRTQSGGNRSLATVMAASDHRKPKSKDRGSAEASTSQADARISVLRTFRRRAWRAGGEHNLWNLLQEEGFATREAFETLFEEDSGNEVPAQECFNWLDEDGDGKISRANFDGKVTRALFGEEFRELAATAGDVFLESMGQIIAKQRPGRPVARCLEVLTDKEINMYAQEALGVFVQEVKALRSKLKQLKTKTRGRSRAGLKFSFASADDQQPQEFKFGTLAMFKQGLDKVIGIPAGDVKEAMEREHQSTKVFTTGNYGVRTFDKQEFDLVHKGLPVDYEQDFERHGRVKPDVDALLQSLNGSSDRASLRLTREELVALVLYTGPLYERYNAVLRETLFPIAERVQAGLEVDAVGEVEYVTTIHMVVSGVLKLSERSGRWEGGKVYRGLQGRVLPRCLTCPDAAGYSGGTELGFMSTTRSLAVAKQYAGLESGQWPTIFEIETGQVDRGAALQAVSQYPGEAEVLLPPLCNLEMTGEPRVRWEGELAYWVVPMRLNVNLKCRTREQYEERRRVEALGHASNVLLDTRQATLAMVDSAEKTRADKQALTDSLLQQGQRLLQGLRVRSAGWFQDDANFARALQDIVHVRSYALEVADAYRTNARKAGYYAQYSMSMWHALKAGDARQAYEAALGRKGDKAGVRAAAVRLAVLEGLLGEGGQDPSCGMDGDSAVMVAAAAGDCGRIALLAHAGCDLNATNREGCTALQRAVVAGNAAAVKTLIELGADKEKGKEGSGGRESPLCHAAEFGRLHCLVELTKAGADITAASSASTGALTPAALAAYNGHLACLRYLKKAGADMKGADQMGRQPIHWAVCNGHVDVDAWLQPHPAKGASKKGSGSLRPRGKGEADAEVACVQWLREAGADVSAKDAGGQQPVHLAAECGHLHFLRWLQRAGADVRAADGLGREPMHLAAVGGHPDCMKWLQGAGASVSARDAEGNEAGHWAARRGRLECLQWLQGAGADLSVTNREGSRPAEEAERNGHVECVAWLSQAGAGPSAR